MLGSEEEAKDMGKRIVMSFHKARHDGIQSTGKIKLHKRIIVFNILKKICDIWISSIQSIIKLLLK